jgi:hypothetical protein
VRTRGTLVVPALAALLALRLAVQAAPTLRAEPSPAASPTLHQQGAPTNPTPFVPGNTVGDQPPSGGPDLPGPLPG